MTIVSMLESGTFVPLGFSGGTNALISAFMTWRSPRVLNAASPPQGIRRSIRVTSPEYVIMKWNGNPKTDNAACASSHDRWPFPQRKVKKSVKIFL
ncbi:hypothetical protein FQZ97_884460 [compost metagenome]